MPETAEEPSKRRALGSWKFILAIVLIIAYSAGAAYGIMGDASTRGLTVKVYNVSRSCTVGLSNTQKSLSYSLTGAIWSSSSLATSLSHLTFTLSADGSVIGTATGSDGSFGPGQSSTFNISFINPTLNPTILPRTSQLVLDLTATVASGLYTSIESTSDTVLQSFGSTLC